MTVPTACPRCLRRSHLLALLGPYIERALIHDRDPGAVSDLLRLSSESLAERVAPQVAGQILARVDAVAEATLTDQLHAADCWAICRHEESYPAPLRDDSGAPWALIGRGDPRLLASLSGRGTVTLTGARRATSYGRQVARELGVELAGAGFLVASGLSFGIDACAHRGALDAGATIAVLPCGPDTAYPAAHRSLWRRIIEQGAVISELPPGATPWRWTVPARSRIMAALAEMVVIVEAAEHSPSMATAACASALDRRLGAVPGPLTSRVSVGPNDLLADGATVVRGAQDVIDAVGAPAVNSAEATRLPRWE